jgi:hypothetical protein
MEPELWISGGAGGVDARYADIVTLAEEGEQFALRLAAISAECHTALVDPDVLASAVLDPGGVARFEKALLGALDSGDGLTALAAGLEAESVALRTAVAAYRATDEASARAFDLIRWSAGYVFADTLPVSLLPLAAAGTPVAAYTLAGGEIDWQRLVTDHPGVVDTLVGAAPGLVSGLPFMPVVTDVPSGAHLVGLLYPDGVREVTDLGPDTAHPAMTQPPRGFGDVLSGLDHRNAMAPEGSTDQIDVRVITHADGTRAYLVDIPGTKDWNPPGFNPFLHDLGTNIHLLADDDSTREAAVAEALRLAGAGPDDPVMLVGHSQGGMLAVQAAHDAGTPAFDYNVTHVLTAGSPVGTMTVPEHVQVISLENSHDIVPHLDAHDNPDRANHTTVTFDRQGGTVAENHSTDRTYLPAAQALDHSADPSVVAYRDSAGAFFTRDGDGATVTARVYEMTRLPTPEPTPQPGPAPVPGPVPVPDPTPVATPQPVERR